jgi:hypothetical protein
MKIGFAISDITPETGIYLTGYGNPERLAVGVHSPLTATAMVLKYEKEEAVVVGLDWCEMDVQMSDEIRKGVAAITGFAESRIVLCCSHTHSAPHTEYKKMLGRTSADPEDKGIAYALKSIPAIADAVSRAQASLRETEAAFAAGKTLTGISRRGLDENGKPDSFIGDPDLVCDDNMTAVLFRDRETRENLGILIHCSAHNTCMGGNRNISSDWCGVMRKRINRSYPVPVLFLNGAVGDVGPRTNLPVRTATLRGFAAGGGDGPASAEEVGFRAATDALRLLDDLRTFHSELPLKVKTTVIKLPQEIPMSEQDARKVVERYEKNPDPAAKPPMDFLIAQTALKTWQEPPQPELEFTQTLISFGPLALAPFPFEMFSVLSLRLRKYGPFEFTLLCSIGNGHIAYMPDCGSIGVGGYEITCRSWERPYVTKPEAGDLAVSQTLKALRGMQ